jgi:hypothetical protein
LMVLMRKRTLKIGSIPEAIERGCKVLFVGKCK